MLTEKITCSEQSINYRYTLQLTSEQVFDSDSTQEPARGLTSIVVPDLYFEQAA